MEITRALKLLVDEAEKNNLAPESSLERTWSMADLRALLTRRTLEGAGPFRPDLYEQAISEAIATANAWIDIADTIRELAKSEEEARASEHRRKSDGTCEEACSACRKEKELPVRQVEAAIIKQNRAKPCGACGLDAHPNKRRLLYGRRA